MDFRLGKERRAHGGWRWVFVLWSSSSVSLSDYKPNGSKETKLLSRAHADVFLEDEKKIKRETESERLFGVCSSPW